MVFKFETLINIAFSRPNVVSAAGLGLGSWLHSQLQGATVSDFLSGAVMGSVLVFNGIKIYREFKPKKDEKQ